MTLVTMRRIVNLCFIGIAMAYLEEPAASTEPGDADNQLIIQEDFMMNESSIERKRRAAGKFNMTCCGPNGLKIQYTEAEMSVFSMCKSQANENASAAMPANMDSDENFTEEFRQLRQKMMCTYDCFFKNMSLVDSTGNMDRMKLQEFLSSKFTEPWQKDMQEKTLDYCLKNKGGRKNNMKNNKCSPQAMITKKCIRGYMELNCPAEQRVRNVRCDRMRRVLGNHMNSSEETQ